MSDNATVWYSPFTFPEKNGLYLGAGEDGYVIASFHRQDEYTGHWYPSWGLKAWTHLPVFPKEFLDADPS